MVMRDEDTMKNISVEKAEKFLLTPKCVIPICCRVLCLNSLSTACDLHLY